MVEKGFIDREVAFDMITDLAGMATTKAAYAAIWKSAKELNKIPAADVVKVVRCKDCKYLMFSDCYGECGRGYLGIVRPDCYCCYGEKKER